jgi:hypothetical protein
VVMAVIGYLPVRAETGKARAAAASLTKGHHAQALLRVTLCHKAQKGGGATCSAGECSRTPTRRGRTAGVFVPIGARRTFGYLLGPVLA